ncbi:winged helix-turn-helix transcriptional regulator [Leptospira licerasiae]|uniref:Transcriptional regulator, MarR family n=1 Tax=Leptospira licerasiae str. MMD4847 TaxID=1049971 RepID=A0ABN0H8J9_9LEPT|nr:winged helix-turn-helix transcriptional regulator [Leptospira licerasiae]EIE00200.1 transcriptional regulator, MarR family [Leptospira licerasiae serovar Varillal str. VAR 010]EJZ41818.1 transcriptional regulator, MarR family [Leptospira licerasiae str. MMD4847]TGM94886.1 MarR family transcriptional regulator [Leptospira licerasiae]
MVKKIIEKKDPSEPAKHQWTFLSHHAHVLLCINADPTVRIRDLATKVGITERAVVGIIEDLEEADIIVRNKEGRRNHYKINKKASLRHKLKSHKTVSDLLRILT